MRETFPGWYQLTDDEVDGLWARALVVTDTNVLLDLYRLTPASRESLLKALRGVSERLWIPYQVGLEFHKSRDDARADVRSRHTALSDTIKAGTRKLTKQVNDLRTFNPAIDSDQTLRESFRNAADGLASDIKARLDEYDDTEEVVLDELDRLFPQQRIGAAFTDEELIEARDTARGRFERKVPPGFADDGKTGDARFGDYFLWRQLLQQAAVTRNGVIFITRDEKEDWRRGEQVLPELAHEFFEATKSHVLVIHPDTFVKQSLQRGIWQADQADDVEAVAEEYKQVERADAQDALRLRNQERLFANMRKAINQLYAPSIDASGIANMLAQSEALRSLSSNITPVDWYKLGEAARSAAALRDDGSADADSDDEVLEEDGDSKHDGDEGGSDELGSS